MYFVGIEGGATCSKVTLIDSKGNTVYEFEGLGTNIWMSGGRETCSERIIDMIKECKTKCDKIGAVGLSISGLENEESKDYYKNAVVDSGLSNCCLAVSDTVSPIATASDQGGIILISGTGSNCRLINVDTDTTYSCGGWGHVIGDGGSAIKLSLSAVQYVFDHFDNFLLDDNAKGMSVTYLHTSMLKYFKLNTREEILDQLYTSFDKAHFAKFAVEISKGCEAGDPLCLYLFANSGFELGRHIAAVAPKIGKTLRELKSGVPIVCTGSMFKSWKYLKPGFLRAFEHQKERQALKLKLIRLNRPSSFGAAILAARNCCQTIIEIDYDAQVTLLDVLDV